MSGYLARVVAMSFGGSAALRPASATRFGARAFEEGALETPADTMPAPRGTREHDRTAAIEPARGNDREPYDAVRRREPDTPLVETPPARAGDERGDARGVVRTPPARSAARDERPDLSEERTARQRSAERADDADSAAGSRRLMPLDDAAAYDDAHALVRVVPQHGDVAPPQPGRARRRAGAGLENRGTADAHADADVYVHIGRIDVRAIAAPERRPAAPRAELRKPSLEAHLRARDAGRA